MRRLPFVALIVALSMPAVHGRAEEGYFEEHRVCAEWSDQAGLHGARLVIRDDRWAWYATHSGTGIECVTCADDSVGLGLLRLGLLDPKEFDLQSLGPIDAALEPDMVDLQVRLILDGPISFHIRSAGDSFPVSVWGLTGKGRVLASDGAGKTSYALAIAAERGAFSVFGVFGAKNGRELSPDDVSGLAAAIAVDTYLPPPDSPLLRAQSELPQPPREPADMHVGNLRQMLEEAETR
jgi:hypothetical protein